MRKLIECIQSSFCKKCTNKEINQSERISQTSDDIEKNLIIEEYKAIRIAILKNIDIIEKFEIYSVYGMAASATFSIYLKKNVKLHDISAFIPLFISIFGIIKYYSIDKTISIYNHYLEDFETNKIINFTTYFRENNKCPSLRTSHYILWIFLILVSLFFIKFSTHYL